MPHILCKSGYTIIKRHWVILLFKIIKFTTIIIGACCLYWLYVKHLSGASFMLDIKYIYLGFLW